MPKLAQFTMLDTDSGRSEKSEIVVAASHVVFVRNVGNENSIIMLSTGKEIRVSGNVEAAFNKLVG